MRNHRVVANCDESSAAHRDRLHDAPIIVDRDDAPTAQHEVGGLGQRGSGEQGEEKSERETHVMLLLSPHPEV